MSAIPSNITRVPNLLLSRAALGNIDRTNLELFQIQGELSSGKAITRFSDDAVRAAAISVLNQRLARTDQVSRNLDNADSALSTLDQALGDASDLVLQAKSIASAQVGTGTTADERQQQAQVVDSLIQGLYTISNRQGVSGSIFGGTTPGSPAMVATLGGYRYMGQGDGLTTDLGLGSPVPITLGASPLGSSSARVRGTADLNPALTLDTQLDDLNGARGSGVARGQIELSINGGAHVTVDLTHADTAQDVAAAVTGAIHDYEQANNTTVLGPGGVSVSGGSLSIDVLPGSGASPNTVQFYDIGSGTTAQDLGLATTSGGIVFSQSTPSGAELDPKLTWRTPISALRGLGAGGLGQIKVNNLGQSKVIDLSGAQTLGDIKNAIESSGLGISVAINTGGTGIDVINQVAAGHSQAMSIEEVSGNGLTATRLGIRSFEASTRISDFNDGRGVQIVDGMRDANGNANPALNTDFTVKLGDAAGTSFTVDLRPQDMATVQTVVDRINDQAQAAGVNVPADFHAGLGDGANGLTLFQNPAWTHAPTVVAENNSPAAQELGLMQGTYDVATGSFRAADQATVRVNNLFTNLIDLRDALNANDTSGITIAGQNLDGAVNSLADSRAMVGGYVQRVEAGSKRQQDMTVVDQKARSDLQDTDFASAASQFTLLQTQLQAALQVTAQSFSHTLLDYLG